MNRYLRPRRSNYVKNLDILTTMYVHPIANARRFEKANSVNYLEPRNLEILGHPLLRNLLLRLASLSYRLAGLELTLDDECAESVVQEVALGLEQAKRVLQLIREDQLQWFLWGSVERVSKSLNEGTK